MSWVRIDDAMPEHPKIVGLSDTAFRMHISALCHCSRYLTDGVFTERAFRAMTANVPRSSRARARKELILARVWVQTRDDDGTLGYEIHDYAEYQPTRAEVLEHRENTAKRVARWRQKTGRGNAVTNASSNGVPSHPIPSSPLPPQSGGTENEDLEPLTPREAGTNPRARNHTAKAKRAHAKFVARTKGLYQQWLDEPGADPQLVAHQIRQAYPDIADEVLA